MLAPAGIVSVTQRTMHRLIVVQARWCVCPSWQGFQKQAVEQVAQFAVLVALLCMAHNPLDAAVAGVLEHGVVGVKEAHGMTPLV